MSTNVVEINNSQTIFEREHIAELPSHLIQCSSCLVVHSKEELKAAGFVCGECGDMVCVTCGCTDSSACGEDCTWDEPGKCSSHGRGGGR